MISLVDTNREQHLNEIQAALKDKSKRALAIATLQTLLSQKREGVGFAHGSLRQILESPAHWTTTMPNEGKLLGEAFAGNDAISGITALQRILAIRGTDAQKQAQELYDVMRKYQWHLPPEVASLFIVSLAQQSETQTR